MCWNINPRETPKLSSNSVYELQFVKLSKLGWKKVPVSAQNLFSHQIYRNDN